MPRPFKIDWRRVQVRYALGVSPKLLAQEFGVPVSCISKRITREHWGELRTENKQAVTDMIEKSLTLQQKSERVKEKLSSELVKQAQTLEKVPAKKNLKALAQRANLTATVASTAEKVFAWRETEDRFLVDPIAMCSDHVTIRRIDDTDTAAIDTPALPDPSQSGASPVD